VDAIAAGDDGAAQQAMARHLDAVSTAMGAPDDVHR